LNFLTFGRLIVSICLLINVVGCASTSRLSNPNQSSDPKADQPYGVSASHPIAVDAGMSVLKNGGNAVDAAIAISYVLGVVEPFGSGLGGGGGMLIVPKSGQADFIDYRETSPDTEGKAVSGVPGLVAGMQYAHDKYGSLAMKALLQPAIDYAEHGFEVDQTLTTRLAAAKPRVHSSETRLFYPNNQAIDPGETLVQKELAKTLKMIQQEGADGFYEGDVARGIKETTNISLEDLKQYEVKERQPVQGTYAGYHVYTAPPPFSGVTLLQMLKLAEETNLSQSPSKADYMEEMEAITKAAYQDRAKHIGDDVDTEKAEQWVANDHIARLKDDIQNGGWRNEKGDDAEEHESTTHFVVMDKNGTVVSVTNTLSNFFGSGDYTNGFFLNDQLKNFGSGINAQEPGKRPRTFTAPTVLKKQGKETIGIGSPGGNRIPQILMQVIYLYTEEEGTFQKIVDRYRFAFDHHTIYTEAPFSEETTDALEERGFEVVHKVSPMYYGGVQVLVKNEENNTISGAGDPRRNGSWKAQQ
jgi:gamma-glutamyltranspeptidase / glutathione hydrolase